MALDVESKELLWQTLNAMGHDDFKAFKFHTHLPKCLDENAKPEDVVNQLEKKHAKNAEEETIQILEKIQNHNLAQKLRLDLARIKGSSFSVDNHLIDQYKRTLQENLRGRYMNAPEGSTDLSERRRLEDVYTELNITYGADATPDKQHEVLQMETCGVAGESIAPRDIFRSAAGRPQRVRTLLTVGFAGIGKTFLVHKFVLDWASGTCNQDVHLLFPFTFREMNLEKGKRFSLATLIRHFIWESKPMSAEMLDLIFVRLQASGKCDFESSRVKVLFVLDGLDECRLKLDLGGGGGKVPDLDVTKAYPLEVLLAHLIKRNLLPCARVWITTRPVGARDIPADLFDSKTEVKGFSESQRLDFFEKKFPGREEVIRHIQKCRSIFIMCHMPIFCWIASVVLQGHMDAGKQGELPKSLTQMYTEFLLYHLDTSERRQLKKSVKDVKALAKLAFRELMKKRQIFYESDLRGSGLDYLRAAKHSGMFAEIRPLKRNQSAKMFQFIHLTVQEYLAALYVMMSLFRDKKNVLADSELSLEGLLSLCKSKPLAQVHEAAIRKACASEGNLDLFLRFLLGLSLPCHQSLLGELLKAPRDPGGGGSRSETVLLIKRRIERNSPEQNINLFYCLNELRDDSLLEQIQRYLGSGRLSTDTLPLDMWSALVFFLLTSEEATRRFDLKRYAASHVGLLMLLPVVKASQESALDDCKLHEASCRVLASAVLGSPSNLRDLDLSDNDLYDRGAELLAAGLAKPHCILQVLRLSGCLVATAGCAALAEALKVNPCHLQVLDLSYNHPGEEGKRLLTEVQRDPGSSLKTLNLDHGGKERLIPGLQKYLCRPALDPDTAHECLRLSDGCKTATVTLEGQRYPPSEQRFTCWRQVLCQDALSGRRYWEADVEGKVYVGVTYGEIRRIGDGDDVCLGGTEVSWALLCGDNGTYSARHDDRKLELRDRPSPASGRLGVFLDHPGGTLSFYAVTPEGPTLLHTYRAAFTQPLYPAFGFCYDNGFDGLGDFVSLGGAGAPMSTRF